MRLAWVTGARGFLGRYAARQLAASGWRVAGIGHGEWPAAEARAWGIELWRSGEIDVASLDAFAAAVGSPQLIFHAAGGGSVGFSLEQPFADFQRTVATTAAVLEAVRRMGAPALVIYPSSAAVYGLAAAQPIAESAPVAPVSPYGVHKWLAEQLCLSAARHHGVRCAVVRYFSVYGPELRKQLLWDLTRRLAAQPREICLHGSGEETRDFLHVEDAARLVALLADAGVHAPAVINGGSGRSVTVRSVSETVVGLCGGRTAIRFSGATRPGDPPHYQADVRQLAELGFAPQRDWADGVREYIEWCGRLPNGEY